MNIKQKVSILRRSAKQQKIGRWLMLLLLVSPMVFSVLGCEHDENVPPDPQKCPPHPTITIQILEEDWCTGKWRVVDEYEWCPLCEETDP